MKESVSILNYLKTKLEKVGQLDMVWMNPLSQTLHSLNLDLEELMLSGKMTSHQILRKNLQCHLLIVRQSVKHSIFVIIIIKQQSLHFEIVLASSHVLTSRLSSQGTLQVPSGPWKQVSWCSNPLINLYKPASITAVLSVSSINLNSSFMFFTDIIPFGSCNTDD